MSSVYKMSRVSPSVKDSPSGSVGRSFCVARGWVTWFSHVVRSSMQKLAGEGKGFESQP